MRRLFALLLALPLAGPVVGSMVAPSEAHARRPAHARASKAAKASRSAKSQKGKKGKLAKGGKGGKRRRHVAERAVPTYTRSGLPNIQAKAAIIVDMATGTELYAKSPDAVRPIASVSKLMAMMVVLDRKLDLDAKTVITETEARIARRGAKSRLPVGMSFTNRDLLHAALMASDNRAVPALGRAVGLDAAQMAAEMTKKAKLLGLKNTRFGDPTGLDNENQSTPREVVRMLQAALKYPLISEITRKGEYVAHAWGSGGRHWTVEYANTDVYTRSSRFTVLGGKTGYTDEAGYCLAIAARLEGRGDVAAAFLGEEGKMTRFADFARAAQWINEKNPVERKAAPIVGPPAPAGTATASAGQSGASASTVTAPGAGTVKASVTPGM